jgi:hypothetical protein
MFRNFVVIHKDGERILMGSMLQNFLRPSFTNFHNKLVFAPASLSGMV